jgi:integrase
VHIDFGALKKRAEIKIALHFLRANLRAKRRHIMGRPLRTLPWITKRSNGVWYVNWYDARARQTRRRSLNTRELDQAYREFERHLGEWRAELVERPRGLNVQHVTITKVLDFYVSHRVESECLDPTRVRTARRHLETFFKNTPLNRIRLSACATYIEARRAGRVRPALRGHSTYVAAEGTIRRELLVLRTAARYALKHELISDTDMPLIEAPPEPPPRHLYLTRAEYQLVESAAGGELKDFITLAYLTGARRRAIENLTAGQVDFDGGHIHLQPGDATARQRRSKKRKPIVPITRALLPLLIRLTNGRAPTERLLPKKDYYSPFNRLLKRLGLAEKGFPHILRHTRATHLLQAGASIYDVAKLLGDTTATVERVYGHHSSESLGRVLDILETAKV